MNNNEQKLSLNAIYERLNSSVHGLSNIEAKRRQEQYGLNDLVEKKKTYLIGQGSGNLIGLPVSHHLVEVSRLFGLSYK